MKNQLNIDLASNNKQSTSTDKTKNVSIPQSTKYSGHSKIKGFSFQLETGMNSKEALANLDNNLQQQKQEKEPKITFTKIEDSQNSQAKQTHKSKISYNIPTISNNLGLNKSDSMKKITSDKEKEISESPEISTKQNGSNPTIDTPLNITDLIKNQNFVPISNEFIYLNFEKYENTRYSSKSLNLIKSFAANTHQGVVRKYNEDRVSIILNIVKPNSFKGNYWPVCSFFGVFDGHGGNKCADYLKDNLHNFVSLLMIFRLLKALTSLRIQQKQSSMDLASVMKNILPHML